MTTQLDEAAPVAPQWEQIDAEILCPLCDYNLRGLIEPRCPECGHRFEWQEVLTFRDRVHPYLFEHHPERSFRSFFQTLAGTFRPWRFWRTLRPTHAVHPKRLLFYWLILVTPVLLAAGVILAVTIVELRADLNTQRQYIVKQLNATSSSTQVQAAIRQYGSAQAYANAVVRLDFSTILGEIRRGWFTRAWFTRHALPLAGAALAWPWLTLLALLIFRISMSRARIKTGHVMRCVIYCTGLGTLLLPPLILLGAHPSTRWWMPSGSWRSPAFSGASISLAALYALLLGLIWLTVRLYIAYRCYLRFPHALATVIASQIIVVLALWKAYLVWIGY